MRKNIVTWGEIATLEYGKSLQGYQNSSGEYPVYGTNGQIGRTEKFLSEKPGVIIGRKGVYRGIHYSKTPFFVIDTAFYLVPKTNQLDLRFAYYQLLTQDINGMDSGSAIPSTSRDDFYRLEIDLPPLPAQKRIADILSSLDDKIELNRKMNSTLEKIGQAIFKHWFVNFEFPNANGEPYRSSGGKMIDSILGEIPEGWEIKTLDDVSNVRGGTTPSTSQQAFWRNGFHHFVTPRDLSKLEVPVLIDTEKKITDVGLNEIGSGLLPVGTLLLSSRAPIGYLAISQIPVAINQGFIGILCDKGVPNSFMLM